jgi:POT family proton-dependent oligopeptide transporter
LHSPDIAFGLPGIFMVIATIFFWAGRKKFVHIPPTGRQFFDDAMPREKQMPFILGICLLVIGLLVWWWRDLGTWFFGVNILLIIALVIWAVRPVLRYIFMPIPFVAMFWALWQQNFSSWIVQAESMDRHLFGINWLSSQIQTVNPIFILIMLPIFSYLVYPLVEKVIPLTPLRKMGAGLFVTAASFFIVAVIQKWIDAGGKPNIIWQIGAFVVLTIGETLVSPVHLEFSYTQGPVKMKSLVMCTYLLAISLGNVFTAGVNFFIQNPDGTVKLQGASYFMFFTYVMLITGVLFAIVMPFYKGRTYLQDQAEEVENVRNNIGLAAQPEV